jgi:hypothetical protein
MNKKGEGTMTDKGALHDPAELYRRIAAGAERGETGGLGTSGGGSLTALDGGGR